MKEIYYDNSATTKVDPRVLQEMLPFFQENFGNPNSAHSSGQSALSAIDDAREKIANYLSCETQEIIFTSGATESNNLAIQGIINSLLQTQDNLHIITSKIEHPSVLEVFKTISKKEGIEAGFVEVDSAGVVKLEKLKELIQPNTVLISIMYANNEVGSIQPIREISEIIKVERDRRGEKGLPIYFHVDAVQAFNYLPCQVNWLGVDFLSFSGHKIFGPKGIGGLFAKRGIKFEPLAFGGHQEYSLRPGTLNVPGIVGLGKAVELVADEQEKNIQKIKKIKSKIAGELEKFENVRFNGKGEFQLPNIINVSFQNAEGESILMLLDMDGVAVSTGSACSSGSLEPSHVLTAMGVQPKWAHGSIRISLGKDNTEVEVNTFIKSLTVAIKKLREMAP
ncbi:cysteine desulfurase [Patescibacteria group bacterium]|nr:cysteine desulfurase [Patescibacteria group bacterium]